MKVISPDWSDFAQGYRLLTAESARLGRKWARDVEDARVSRYNREHGAWSDKLTRVRRRSVATRRPCVATAGVGALVMAVALIVLANGLVFTVGLVATVGALLTLFLTSVTFYYLVHEEPSLAKTPGPAVDVATDWWNAIGTVSHARRVHGDIGEEALLRQLSATLPDNYLCMRGILVARSLDADVIVIGPSGLWVFDSKYWSGTITVRNGRWARKKKYYEPGGHEAYRDDSLRPFDRQWMTERDAIQTTLARRLHAADIRSIPITGGIVFTHPDVTWDIDASCSVSYGRTADCVGWIARANAMNGGALTPDLCLAAFDALTAYARMLGAPPAQQSASALASSLIDTMDRKMVQFVAQYGGAIDVMSHGEASLPAARTD